MFDTLPDSIDEFMGWGWPQMQPYFEDLLARDLTDDTLHDWLADHSRLSSYLYEMASRLNLATSLDTTDEEAEAAWKTFMQQIYPQAAPYSNKLNRKLLDSGLTPEAIRVPLRNVRAEVEIYRKENIPLIVKVDELGNEYDRVMGGQTVEWEGEELTVTQLSARAVSLNRAERERAWRLGSERILLDREVINANWVELLKLRQQIAENAGFTSYRDYAWKDRGRFDYTPEDCLTFHAAIEETVVPAAERVYQRFAEQLGVETLRPWDLNVNPLRTTDLDLDPLGRDPLRPFEDVSRLAGVSSTIFNKVDPVLGGYYDTMRQEDLMNLPNTRGKRIGAFCTYFPVAQRPFVFMNAVGKHNDVQTMLHEFGHAFHAFEASQLDYLIQGNSPMEFSEVASMAMELLAAPYLEEAEGGFYSADEAARARVEHLYSILMFWPYMAVVDGFQHWVYENVEEALDPANCDAKWAELWARFMKGIDYTGLEDDMMTGWHRKLHIHRMPFYYIEYGLAQLGAVQVWSNALQDQAQAVERYRSALALGGTVPLPDLYEQAGARLAFDSATLGEAVNLVEGTITELRR